MDSERSFLPETGGYNLTKMRQLANSSSLLIPKTDHLSYNFIVTFYKKQLKLEQSRGMSC